MIRLVITDIGGVLVKTDEAIITAIERVFRQNEIEPGSRESMLEAFGVSIRDYIAGYLPADSKHSVDDLYDQFKEIYPWRVLAPGPGHGIQMTNGRLVVTFWLSDGGSK